MTAAEDEVFRTRLAGEAARIRDSGDLGRSEPLNRLFDFLLECSLEGRVPKEVEVAQQVFGKTDFDVMQDASVRVYIHRLRRKLIDHYAREPEGADPVAIPLGEYRFVFAEKGSPGDVEAEPEIEPAATIDPPPRRRGRISRFWAVVALFALANVAVWAVYLARPSGDAAIVWNKLWLPIAQGRRPTFVAVGDYYVFGDAPDGVTVTRLIRAFDINSREDLDAYLMANAQDMGRYIDVNLHYLPVSIGSALRSLLPVINAAAVPSGIRPQVRAISELTPDVLKNANVVYIGFLSGLGLLRDPVFEASGFKVGANYDQLIDKASGRRFTSDWGVVADGKTPQRDYGYIASLPGPAGNRILIVAGTRDAAVAQMAEVAADPQQLAAIDAKASGGAFEALYEVRTLGNLNLGSSLVLVRPLRAGGIWQPGQQPDQTFPDQPKPAAN